MGIWIFLTCMALAFGAWGMYENHRQAKLKSGRNEQK